MNWIPTHEIDHNGRKVLVMLRGYVGPWGGMYFYSQPAYLKVSSGVALGHSHGSADWMLDANESLLTLDGSSYVVPNGATSCRKLSEREPHYVVDDERESGAFTLGEFVEMNRDSDSFMREFFVHELCMIVLLKTGDAHTFGGGAMAETTIRRVR